MTTATQRGKFAPKPTTAFPRLAAELGRQIREAKLDYEAFSQRLKRCDLSECRARCCHDGVYLSPEEVEVISNLPLADGWLDSRAGRRKSATVVDPDIAADFPAHFPQTRCVFLDQDHRCKLQLLSVEKGHHPWFWKPVSCWMHPLLIDYDLTRRPVLTIAKPGADRAAGPAYPGFGSFTPCGMNCGDGEPAWRTLTEELEVLGALADRDLTAELSAISEVHHPRCSGELSREPLSE